MAAKVKKGIPPGVEEPGKVQQTPATPPPQQLALSKGDEDEADDDEDDDKENPFMKSSGVDENDLQKSIDQLNGLIDSAPENRQKILMEKSLSKGLNETENEELRGLLGGKKLEKSLSERVAETQEGSEDFQKSIDVSPYLTEAHDLIAKSLGTVAGEVEAASKVQHGFNIVLAKSLVTLTKQVMEQGELIKAMAGQPARSAKSQIPGKVAAAQAKADGAKTGGKVLEKGFANEDAAGESVKLSKSQIMDGLEDMIEKSAAKGGSGKAANGEDMTVALSRYEQFGEMKKSLFDEVVNHLQASTH